MSQRLGRGNRRSTWRSSLVHMGIAIGCWTYLSIVFPSSVWAQNARASQSQVSAAAVRQAIHDGVAFLKSRQLADGTWGDYSQFRGGLTALVVHALLTCGEPIDDPVVERGLNAVRTIPLERTYVVSLQTLVLCRAGLPTDRNRIAECVRWLESAQAQDGGWAYTERPNPGTFDLSNTQFAILALFEAQRYGVSVSVDTWKTIYQRLQTFQNQDGSWGYSRGNRTGTGSMTCAGIGSMMMTLDSATGVDARVVGNQIQCCLNTPTADDVVEKGMQWIGRNFSASRNPGSGEANRLYYLYGIERIGRLTCHRFFEGNGQRYDWYREGCDSILGWKGNLQDHWSNMGGNEQNELIATSFALLFLAKGRMPILFSVLDANPTPIAEAAEEDKNAATGANAVNAVANDAHANQPRWNPHRNAFRNLTDYVGQKWKMELTYQTIPLDLATAEELSASPVLYLGGQSVLYPNDVALLEKTAAKMRNYLEHGGFLYVASDGPLFDQSFREWMKLVFPEPEYQLKLLPATHPVWHNEEILAADQARPAYGVEFGCRTSVIYFPSAEAYRPLSCLWELRPLRGNPLMEQPMYAPAVQSQVQAGMALGINVLAYATNRRLQGKEEIFDQENAARERDTMLRGRLAIASILHGGGCSAAPRALENLLQEAATQLKYRIATDSVELAATDPKIFRYPVLFIHGRSEFQFNDAERLAIRAYLERGGTIFADAVCGSDAFAKSFREEMAKIMPDAPLAPLDAQSALYTTEFGGFDLSRVTRREVVGTRQDGTLDIQEKVGPPTLEAIAIHGKYRLFFSAYDLSCALEKADSIDCKGYLRDDAARIALNIILYGLQQ